MFVILFCIVRMSKFISSGNVDQCAFDSKAVGRDALGQLSTNGSMNLNATSCVSTHTDIVMHSYVSHGYTSSSNRGGRMGHDNCSINMAKDSNQFQSHRMHSNSLGTHYHRPHFRENYGYANNSGNYSPRYSARLSFGANYNLNVKNSHTYWNHSSEFFDRRLQEFMILREFCKFFKTNNCVSFKF